MMAGAVAAAETLPSVLHIDTERGWRGGERQVLWLAGALAARGHRTWVAARTNMPLARRAAQAGLAVVACAPTSEFAFLTARELRRIVRRERIAVVHAHTGHAVALAALSSLGTDAAMVLTRRVDFRLRANPLTRWKYGRADAIIAISSAVADALVESGVERHRITIVPSGIDLERAIEPPASGTLAQLGVNGSRPLVVMVAALVQHKDPLNFVRAVAEARRRVPTIQALMVGDGPLRAGVESEIQRLALGGAIRVAGMRDDADALLAAADIVVLSSEEEGLGTVLLDAMALGRPVAATSGGGIPEIVVNGETGLLTPVHDPVALGAAIAAIAMDEGLARRLGDAGRRRAAEFSVERTAERTAEVYARVVARQSGGRT